MLGIPQSTIGNHFALPVVIIQLLPKFTIGTRKSCSLKPPSLQRKGLHFHCNMGSDTSLRWGDYRMQYSIDQEVIFLVVKKIQHRPRGIEEKNTQHRPKSISFLEKNHSPNFQFLVHDIKVTFPWMIMTKLSS